MGLMYSSMLTAATAGFSKPKSFARSICGGLLAGLVALVFGSALAGAADGDDLWDRRFGNPFLNGTVAAMATGDDGVYVGGSFTLAGAAVADQGGTTVNHILLWRDGAVTALGAGLNGTVNAIAVSGSNVYVGGEFTQAGGMEASRVARWDGHSWSPMGGGVSGTVHAIAVQGNDVYVGGNFTTAGGVTVNGIARWDGSAWSAVGGGLGASATIRALAFYNGQLHAGGFFILFQTINNVPVLLTYLAKWDGSAWSPLGSGVNNQVNTLLAEEGQLYAGGTFTTAGGVTVNKIARWNGSAWSALGAGFSTGITDAVNALTRIDGQLYAGGYFETADEAPASALARWDGATWTSVNDGVVSSIGGMSFRATVSALAATGGKLHVGGSFNQAGNRTVSNAAIWSNGRWLGFGMGLAGPAYAVRHTESGVLVGGMFPTAGSVPVNSIARWDGDDWSPLGGGVQQSTLPGQVYAIATHGTNVYVAGVFTRAGTINALNIARWNGSEWFPLGSGIGGFGAVVRALTIAPDGSLYAGGFFTSAGGNAVTHLARWDGLNWSAAGNVTANGGQAEVRALATLGNDIYAGGAFNNIGGISTVGIARWNGSAWSAVGGGMDNSVLALAVGSQELYAGGYFTTAGGVQVNRIARWNGTSWAALGDGIGNAATNFVSALAVDGARVYAGGLFAVLGNGTPANYIAVWEQNAWAALGSGTSAGSPPAVYGLAVGDGRIYAAGVFGRAGGIPSNAFAMWNQAVAEPLELNLALAPGGSRIIRFTAPQGQTFQVWSTTSLASPFVPFSDPIPGTGEETSFEDDTPPGNARYYQLRQLP
jgi:trimeric autotransporter adhesin